MFGMRVVVELPQTSADVVLLVSLFVDTQVAVGRRWRTEMEREGVK